MACVQRWMWSVALLTTLIGLLVNVAVAVEPTGVDPAASRAGGDGRGSSQDMLMEPPANPATPEFRAAAVVTNLWLVAFSLGSTVVGVLGA